MKKHIESLISVKLRAKVLPATVDIMVPQRQTGVTTTIMEILDDLCWNRPGYKCAVVASVVDMAIPALRCLKGEAVTKYKAEYKNESSIEIRTASLKGLHGTKFDAIFVIDPASLNPEVIKVIYKYVAIELVISETTFRKEIV